MLTVTATQIRGNIQQYPEGTIAGQWRWSLVGPAPQSQDTDSGGPVTFEIDEVANPGEYMVQSQRLDDAGGMLGPTKTSAPFTISAAPTVDIEVAGDVTVSVSSPGSRKARRR